MNKYYQMIVNEEQRKADIYIYGDITSWQWDESDVTAYPLVKDIDQLKVDTINVFINSYGGEVAVALAICSALERNPAKVVTYCDGFACSAAADIFMAGTERIMSDASLLMIHNAWTVVGGNAEELRKGADDIEKISKATLALYLGKVNVEEDVLQGLFDAETWLTPQEAFDMNFATSIVKQQVKAANQSAKKAIIQKLIQKSNVDETTPPAVPEKEPEPDALPEEKTNTTKALFQGLFL